MVTLMTLQKIGFTTKLLSNKTLLKGLEKISEHGTSFSAGTSLLLSLGVRPLAIKMTPDVEKENKQYAMSNSICSGLVKFAIVEAIALPIEKAVKNIDENPEKFLKSSTIKKLTGSKESILSSRSYKLMTQIIKLSTGFLTAIPKSIVTVALIPILMDKLFLTKKQEKVAPPTSKDNFSGNFTGGISNSLSKGIGKIIDNKRFLDFATKYETKDKDIAKHITATTDILLTATSAYCTNKSEDIKENRKKALIYNNIVSTAITLIGGYSIDRIIKNKTENFVENFKKINIKDPKLNKYIEGINILRPAIIFAGIYYGLLPIISTYTGEKIDKFVEKRLQSYK